MSIRVETPAGAWCRRATLEHPDERIRVLSCFPLGPQGFVEVVEFTSPRWRKILNDIRQLTSVERIEILEEAPEKAVVRLSVTACGLPRVAALTGILPQFPFEVKEGHDRWLIISPQPEAKRFLDLLTAQGVKAEVTCSGEYVPPRALTERQREILAKAVKEGFYDYPRRITLTDLAHKLGIAKSTLSQALMIVEREILGGTRGDLRTRQVR